jgi:hypothetical protein
MLEEKFIHKDVECTHKVVIFFDKIKYSKARPQPACRQRQVFLTYKRYEIRQIA